MTQADTMIGKLLRYLFWTLWGALGLLCLLMVFESFSILRLLAFSALLFVLVYYKQKLFTGYLNSLLISMGAVFLFFVIIVITSGTSSSKEEVALSTVQKVNDVTVVLVEGVLAENATMMVNKAQNPSSESIEGVVFETYDIALPQGTVMEGVAEIKLPYEKKNLSFGVSPQDGISAAYFDEQANSWSFVPCIVDTDQKVVKVFTDHFSKYAVVYYKDGRKKLTQKLPEFDSMPSDYETSELERIFTELGEDDQSPTALLAGWNQFNAYYGLSGATGNLLAAAVDAKTLTGVNNLMTEVGVGFAFTQVAFDLYNGDTNAAVNNFVKNAASYSVSKWGGSALGLASAGVTVIDISLNKFAEKALEKNLQKWEDAYRYYYETNPKAKRSAVEWLKIVERLHKAAKSPEEFKAKLDQALDEYSDIFWKDAEAYAYVADKTPGIRGFGAGGEFSSDAGTIKERFKEYTYANTIKTVMQHYTKKLWLAEFRKAEAKMKKLKAEMNKEYTVTVHVANYGQIKNLQGAMVRFKNEKGKVIHSQSLDASGRAVLKTTLFGFLKAEGPVQVEVKIPAQDNTPEYKTTLTYKLDKTQINLNVPYTPGQKPQETPIQKPGTQTGTKTETPTTKPTAQPPVTQPTTPSPTTPPPAKEYNYAAALAAWSADFAARENAKKYSDAISNTTCDFEWIKAPFIKDGQVYAASRLWYNEKFHAGPLAGTNRRYVASQMYDATNPGVFISLGNLKKLYPQFGN